MGAPFRCAQTILQSPSLLRRRCVAAGLRNLLNRLDRQLALVAGRRTGCRSAARAAGTAGALVCAARAARRACRCYRALHLYFLSYHAAQLRGITREGVLGAGVIGQHESAAHAGVLAHATLDRLRFRGTAASLVTL